MLDILLLELCSEVEAVWYEYNKAAKGYKWTLLIESAEDVAVEGPEAQGLLPLGRDGDSHDVM